MFLRVNDHIVHVQVSGNPATPVLVLLHSLGTCAQVWDAQVRRLESHRFVVRPDFRGHGLSEESREEVTIERLADDVLAVLDALSIQSFDLAGISIGGMVAQTVAARAGDRVSTLVLFDTTIASHDPSLWQVRARKVREQGLGAVVNDIYPRWLPSIALDRPEAFGLLQMLRRTPEEGYAACCDALANADCRKRAVHITAPTVVAVGTEDRATPPAMAEALASAIAGARLMRIEGAAHIPLISHAEEAARILEDAICRDTERPRQQYV